MRSPRRRVLVLLACGLVLGACSKAPDGARSGASTTTTTAAGSAHSRAMTRAQVLAKPCAFDERAGVSRRLRATNASGRAVGATCTYRARSAEEPDVWIQVVDGVRVGDTPALALLVDGGAATAKAHGLATLGDERSLNVGDGPLGNRLAVRSGSLGLIVDVGGGSRSTSAVNALAIDLARRVLGVLPPTKAIKPVERDDPCLGQEGVVTVAEPKLRFRVVPRPGRCEFVLEGRPGTVNTTVVANRDATEASLRPIEEGAKQLDWDTAHESGLGDAALWVQAPGGGAGSALHVVSDGRLVQFSLATSDRSGADERTLLVALARTIVG